jgi:hypothetical protein
MSPHVVVAKEPKMPPATQWFALVAPAVAWSAHELASWYVASTWCGTESAGAARIALPLISAVALAVAMAGMALGYGRLRSAATSAVRLTAEGRSRDEMLALSSVFLGAVFTLGLVWASLPSFFLSPVCEPRP